MIFERRNLVGIVALVSLLGAAAMVVWPPDTLWAESVRAGLLRGGTLAAVVWLAYPDMCRLPAWLWVALLAILVVVAVRPRTILVAVPIILILAILRPRFGRRQ